MVSGLMVLVGRVVEFHGHFGPFLVLGVRLGVFGLGRLGVRHGEHRLNIIVGLRRKPPYSCILDGVQVSTGCTLGNGRLMVEESSKVYARFSLRVGIY